MLFFPDYPVFVTLGCLQTLQLEGGSLVLLLLWFNSLQLLMLWAAAPNSALGELIMETLALRGFSELAEILPPSFVGPLPKVKVCFGSEGVWSVFLAYFTGSPGDHPLQETGCAPVPVICVGTGGCV